MVGARALICVIRCGRASRGRGPVRFRPMSGRVFAWVGLSPLGSKDTFLDFEPRNEADGGEQGELALREIAGQIKWFDVAKGYGFIVPDEGGADVMLHVTTLRRDGHLTAREGARVVCEVLQRPKGLQVFRVLSLDLSTAVHPAQTQPPRTHQQVVPSGGFEVAVCKWFNRIRGFGFLSRGDGTDDIFIHMETLRRFGITELKPGDSFLVRFGEGSKGLMAAEIRPLDGGPSTTH